MEYTDKEHTQVIECVELLENDLNHEIVIMAIQLHKSETAGVR